MFTRPAPYALRRVIAAAALAATGATAGAQVVTAPTTDTSVLGAALNPTGLTITSVSIRAGQPGQFGTFTNFEAMPVTIRPGIVLSSGDVTDMTPIPGATDPAYDPASPPGKVNSQMTPEPDSGGTPEFDAFGSAQGNIENFSGSFDVAALRVDFTMPAANPIKFDFLFGSVEFPYWTSQFTDSFLVFLDGTAPANQIAFDASGNAVQVGSSFAGLETTADLNTAFSNPHGMIHHLTTTSPTLSPGHHYLIFEVADVNDHILDSAAFICNLRAEAGNPGTDPTDDTPHVGCPRILIPPAPATACAGSPATMSVGATGAGPLTYRWYARAGSSGTWTTLGETPTALPCGGTAAAFPANSPTTQISIDPCPGVTNYQVRCKVINDCGDQTTDGVALTLQQSCCDTTDFNGDGLWPDTADIDDFLSVFSGGTCADGTSCNTDIDFNNDGLFPDTSDIDSLLSVFSGGPCL
ncbi:MAG: choice-of-anchor L domain-containing protein [Phycisphaerales bacterium]